MHAKARDILDRLGFPLKPGMRVAYLSRAEQQMVEIAKAFRSELSVLILDEPTASLTERETQRLFTLIEQAKRQGVGIIYITHRMNEIKRIGDRITVLRDGRKIATLNVAETSEQRLVELMTGRVIAQIFPKITYRPGPTILEVKGLTTAAGNVSNVSIRVRGGEVVGLAGLVGSGKSEVARACFGVEPIALGDVTFDGEDVRGMTPRQMLDRGFFYLPPDRRDEGLVMVRGARENISLPSLNLPRFSSGIFLNRGAERAQSRGLAKRLNLHPLNIERAVDHFSGGNQQKVLLAKALSRDVKLFVFDEPTVGVDVGTRVAIYKFIAELCEAGAAILLISSDLPEILHLTNRAYVMHRGVLRAELMGSEISEDRVLSHFFEREAGMTTESTPQVEHSSQPLPLSLRLQQIFVRLGVLPFLLLIAIIVFSLLSSRFYGPENIKNVLRQSSYLTMVAMGQMLALLTGGFDLSVGTILAVTSVFGASAMAAMHAAFPDATVVSIAVGMLAGVGAGTLIGIANGAGVALAGVSPFMMTLGMASIGFGISLFQTGGVPVYGMPKEFGKVLGFGQLFGFLAAPVIVTIALIVVMYVLLNWTRMGRYLYAIGGNLKASTLSGINTRLYLFLAYVLCGTMTAISGIMLTARLETGEANIGATMPLESIAACVIGGVSLRGGTGKLANVVLGAIFIGLVQNGMNLARIESYLQIVVIGILLIVAVMADQLRQKMMAKLRD